MKVIEDKIQEIILLMIIGEKYKILIYIEIVEFLIKMMIPIEYFLKIQKIIEIPFHRDQLLLNLKKIP